jgi:sugar/nucleoside kinase (ribokinase family)
MYADLHSLMLGIDATGVRTPRSLDHWRDWLRCFDVIQVNEDELASLASAWGDPWRFAADVVGDELKLLLITLGSRGAAYVASEAFKDDPFSWRPQGIVVPPVRTAHKAISKKLPAVQLTDPGDPTGCGDVWGATCFSRMLGGDSLEDAVIAANRAAARNVQHRGATGLNLHLQGRLTS